MVLSRFVSSILDISTSEVSMITGVNQVVLHVGDQEQAKRFWTDTVGFTLTQDAPYGDERWIEVTPPDGSVTIVLAQRPAGQERPEVRDELPHSPVFFTCDDITATHRELAGRGVRFPTPPREMPFGWWSMFEDPDGTRYALGQHD
jgi:predicted enzyme related to lactoylglutathione lyase